MPCEYIRSWLMPSVFSTSTMGYQESGEYDCLSDLEAFLDQEWIRRAWTFQEIMLASNPILICGNAAIGWRQLQEGLGFVNDTSFFLILMQSSRR